jgi:hypothetical protein
MKKQFYIGALSLMASVAQADVYPSIHEGKKVEVIGFECADSALHVMEMLGRGPNFPDFLISDVEIELERQNKGSQLVSITCTAEPELMAGSVTLQGNSSKSIVSRLSLSVPLEITVSHSSDAANLIQLSVEQNYFVENLDKDNQAQVTQNFIVKASR